MTDCHLLDKLCNYTSLHHKSKHFFHHQKNCFNIIYVREHTSWYQYIWDRPIWADDISKSILFRPHPKPLGSRVLNTLKNNSFWELISCQEKIVASAIMSHFVGKCYRSQVSNSSNFFSPRMRHLILDIKAETFRVRGC